MVFGLYHGLVVLPVVLATLGPEQESQSESSSAPTLAVWSAKSSSDTTSVKTKTNIAFEETEVERDRSDINAMTL